MNASALVDSHFMVDNETYTILQGLNVTDGVGSLPLIPSHRYHSIDTIFPFPANLSWVSNSAPYLMLLPKHRDAYFTGPLFAQLTHQIFPVTCVINMTPERYSLSDSLQQSWRSLELNLNAIAQSLSRLLSKYVQIPAEFQFWPLPYRF